MTGLDTNVLVRYLTQDDPVQARRATREIDRVVAAGERCFIGPIVLCELVWVLREAYDTPKAKILEALDRILDTVQFEIGAKDQAAGALAAYRTGRADFADYFLVAMSADAGCEETVSFDRRLRRVPGVRVL